MDRGEIAQFRRDLKKIQFLDDGLYEELKRLDEVLKHLIGFYEGTNQE